MPTAKATAPATALTREKLIDLLNEDLSREYPGHHRLRQLLPGPQGRAVHEHRRRARRPRHRRARARPRSSPTTSTISAACPPSSPSPSRPPRRPRTCSASISKTRSETIANYRRRIKQCDELNEFAIAEYIREILIQEQDHLIALATALGIDPPNPGIAD